MESIVNMLMGSGIADFLPREVVVFIISLLPILELRGGLLAASLLNLSLKKALIICMIGNIIPVPFILLFIKKIFAFMKRKNLFPGLVDWLENKAMSKKGKIEKYEFWGLVLFVGIPLPGTGAWTGNLIAALIDMDTKKAVLATAIGLCLAAAIMSLLSYGVLGNIIR